MHLIKRKEKKRKGSQIVVEFFHFVPPFSIAMNKNNTVNDDKWGHISIEKELRGTGL